MPSRRALLAVLGTSAVAGAAGCVGRLDDRLGAEPTLAGPCEPADWTWQTAGGDPGRTGRTDADPPPADADAVDLLGGVRTDGRQRLAESLPAIADGTVYVPSGPGIVAVPLDAAGDGPPWTFDLGEAVQSMPTVACGAVLAPGLNELAAIDVRTGEPVWRAAVGAHETTSVAVADGTVFVAGANPHAVDLRTGRVEWHAEAGDTVAVDDGVFTTLNANGTGAVFAHDRDGDPRWQLSLGKIVGSATVLGDTVWVADSNGTVYAIDTESGETRWSRQYPGVAKVHSGLAVRGGDLAVPAGVGDRSLVVDAATGEPRWTASTGFVTGRPVIGADWVAFGRTNHGVTVYDRASGTERRSWTREAYNLGTIDGLVPVDEGFVVHEGSRSGLTLIR